MDDVACVLVLKRSKDESDTADGEPRRYGIVYADIREYIGGWRQVLLSSALGVFHEDVSS